MKLTCLNVCLQYNKVIISAFTAKELKILYGIPQYKISYAEINSEKGLPKK